MDPFWPFSGIGWSSLFRYHEWALTLTLARVLTQRCECIFSKLHSSQGMSAGNVHKTMHTGQTWRSRYRHFLLVLLSWVVPRDCVATTFSLALQRLPCPLQARKFKISKNVSQQHFPFCCPSTVRLFALEGQSMGRSSSHL